MTNKNIKPNTQENLLEKTCQFLDKVEITSPNSFSSLCHVNSNLIEKLKKEGFLNQQTLKARITQSIYSQALNDYNYLTSPSFSYSRYADHIGDEASFAYCLKHNFFTHEETEKIPFDHGENKESYIQEYLPQNFIEKLSSQLLNPIKPQKQSPSKENLETQCNCCFH